MIANYFPSVSLLTHHVMCIPVFPNLPTKNGFEKVPEFLRYLPISGDGGSDEDVCRSEMDVQRCVE